MMSRLRPLSDPDHLPLEFGGMRPTQGHVAQIVDRYSERRSEASRRAVEFDLASRSIADAEFSPGIS